MSQLMSALLERDGELRQLGRWLEDAARGSGRVVLVEGEAGVGKTSLVRAFLDSLGRSVEVWTGQCDPLATPRPFGPLLDIAADAGGPLPGLLRDEAPPFDVFRAVLDALRAPGPPRVVLIEDIHWADGASLDLIRFLSRRLAGVRALLLVTYRTDGLRVDCPALIAVGDITSLAWVDRLPLGGLSRDAVAQLTSGTQLDPGEVHRVTGGNAFYVTEVVAARDTTVPPTVRDAILARASSLSESGFSTLETASVLGPRAETSLLLSVGEMAGADECVAGGVLIERDGALVFRHELARKAILESVLPGRRMRIAAAALAELSRTPAVPAELARLAALAEDAQDHASALRHAAAAARHAAAVGSHCEADAQYQRALRHAAGLDPAERALLLERQAYESYLTDRIPEAIAARRSALAIWNELGDRLRLGETTRWLSRLYWYNGEGEAAEDAACAALELLEPMGASSELAWAYSNLSQLRMLGDREAEAIELSRRAIAIGEEVGDPVVVIHALNNVGTTRCRMGVEEGWEDLRTSLRLALAGGYDEHAARAYVNLYWTELGVLRLGAAELTFSRGLEYCTERDLDSWRLYLLGCRCQHLLLRGDWSRAGELCAEIDRGRVASPVTRVTPLAVLGLMRARRGDPGVTRALDEAMRLASGTNEPQRLVPALMARGEVAWLGGDVAAAASAFRSARDLVAGGDAWAWSAAEAWLARIGEPTPGVAGSAVGPYRLELAGEHAAAGIEWRRLGCPYEEALALARADGEGQRRAVALLDGLGARVTLSVVSRALRAAGARALPRGPRRGTRDNPFGLTNREVEVCELLRRGLRNAEIATRLHLAPRTVEHHVASIMGKTGASTRTEAAAVLTEHLTATEK